MRPSRHSLISLVAAIALAGCFGDEGIDIRVQNDCDRQISFTFAGGAPKANDERPIRKLDPGESMTYAVLAAGGGYFWLQSPGSNAPVIFPAPEGNKVSVVVGGAECDEVTVSDE